MPRPSRVKSAGAEANLARRVEYEREKRGLSYEALAKLVTETGCKIQGSAIYKIEKADPPRRITVDELTAFAEIFTDGDVAELLKPMEVVEDEHAKELLRALQQNERNLTVMFDDVMEVMVDLLDTQRDNRDLYDYVMNHWARDPRGSAGGELREPDDLLIDHMVIRAAYEVRMMWILSIARIAGVWLENKTRAFDPEEVADIEAALESDEPWISRSGWLFDGIEEEIKHG